MLKLDVNRREFLKITAGADLAMPTSGHWMPIIDGEESLPLCPGGIPAPIIARPATESWPSDCAISQGLRFRSIGFF